ncbi:MAG: mandelate racemase/muconate lactonizing enzyme family protein [Burkholderiaceae bacterium]
MRQGQETDTSFEIAKVEAFVFRAPADPPVRTSFGIMYNRPALLIRLTDSDGVMGWGEVWCNFPSVGAEHRARLALSVLRPLLCGQVWPSPRACFDALAARLRILAIQSGEPGPLAQVAAGVDVAVWDIQGKRARQPLWRLLGGSDTVAVYASGINPDQPLRMVEAKAREGYDAFKLKVGFDDKQDLENISTVRAALGQGGTLMADANQGWNREQAADMLARLEPYDLTWLEEPVAADTPWADWKALSEGTHTRLAAGENLRGEAAFQAAADEGGVRVIQPDLGKWGGFSGCLPVGRDAQRRGHWFCPHWLGAGIGLVASMHLKAALGGAGYVEIDANPNPLRDILAQPAFTVKGGKVVLSDLPGLGVEPALEEAAKYLVSLPQD